jgi:hypothetical protein
MSVTADRIDDLFRQPVSDVLPALRAVGLLPERTTEVLWTPNPDDVQPNFAALAQIDVQHPFSFGHASMTSYGAQWVATGGSAEVSIRSHTGSLDGMIFLNFTGLGANRKCIAWVDLRVYGGSSLTLGGTGNPSTVVVSSASTGGQRTSVPLALTAMSNGQASAYVVPTLAGQGGVWYSTIVYGL